MWKMVKLGDICEVITKGTTPTSVGFKFENDGINFVKVESIYSDGTFLPSKFAKISEDCHLALKRSQLFEGDILFSIAGALGRTAIVTKEIVPANTNQALAILRLKADADVDKKFLLYVLNSDGVKEQSNSNKGGVAQQNLSLSQLKNYLILLPPLAEQQRIVAKLDAAFAEIDEMLSLTQSKIDALEKLITSSLKELDNVNDAEEFTINTLCKELYAGGDAPSKDKLSLTRTDRFKIPIFSNGSKNAGLYGYCEEARTVEPAITISARGTIGHIELRHEPFLPIVRLIVAIPNTDIVQVKFLKYALLGSKIFSSGSSIPQLTVPMLRDLTLRIPNLPTQKAITSKLDMLFELREKFQSIQNKKLVQLSALKSALLAQELQSEAA